MAPRHSIILSSYNRPTMVHRAIRSVLDQTVKDLELIVADDESNPETLRSIQAAAQGDPRFRLHCPTGTAHLRKSQLFFRFVLRINESLRLCQGDIIHYLCDDDWYLPERLAAFDLAFATPSVIVAYGRLVYRNNNGGVAARDRFPHAINGSPRNILDHNQVAHRRVALEKVPDWPLELRADGGFFEHLAKHFMFYPVDKPVAVKRLHELNMLSTTAATTDVREATDPRYRPPLSKPARLKRANQLPTSIKRQRIGQRGIIRRTIIRRTFR